MDTLDTLLDDWAVIEYNGSHFMGSLDHWWGVANTEGIIAYFSKEEDAFHFRLSKINRILNG